MRLTLSLMTWGRGTAWKGQPYMLHPQAVVFPSPVSFLLTTCELERGRRMATSSPAFQDSPAELGVMVTGSLLLGCGDVAGHTHSDSVGRERV